MTSSWTLMNSHGVVLFFIAGHPDVTMRGMSVALDITERRVAQIVKDLVDAEMLSIERVGRRNTYSVKKDSPFRHPTLQGITLGQFEELLISQSVHEVAMA